MKNEIDIVGIDEAGRGPVIGPMVLAGVKIHPCDSQKLTDSGVNDSKQLSPKKRSLLVDIITEIAKAYVLIESPPEEIDHYCLKKRLNILEAEKAWEIIQRLDAKKVYIDAPGKGGKKFAKYITGLAGSQPLELIAENFADQNYPVVAAASILAKVTRDHAIEKLRARFGDFGSGYPSDPKTRKFLREALKKRERLPYIRYSWDTVKKLQTGEQAEFFCI